MPDTMNETAWIVGAIVGGAVVLVVVALLLTIIGVAAGIERRAAAIVETLGRAHENTNGMWEGERIMWAVSEIGAAARAVEGAER